MSRARLQKPKRGPSHLTSPRESSGDYFELHEGRDGVGVVSSDDEWGAVGVTWETLQNRPGCGGRTKQRRPATRTLPVPWGRRDGGGGEVFGNQNEEDVVSGRL